MGAVHRLSAHDQQVTEAEKRQRMYRHKTAVYLTTLRRYAAHGWATPSRTESPAFGGR
jgi:hypothetical protein